MGINFKVAMVLEAVNRMDGGIRGAMNSVGRLRRSFADAANETARMNPVTGWSERVKQVGAQMEKLQKQAEKIQKRAGAIQRDGFENIATGVGLGLPVFEMINKAAERQRSQMVLREAGMEMTDVEDVTNRARDLSKELMFGVNELMTIPLAMQRAGMNAEKIKNSFQQIAYMAELEHLRTGDSAYNISKEFAQMAEQARVTQDSEALRTFAEAVNRVATVTTANIHTLSESSKYFTIIGKGFGITPEDIMMHQGFMARMGLEGTVGGTNLKDFYQRINPWYHERIGGSSKEALADMKALGWTTGSETTVMKSGREKFISPGQSIFYDTKGNAKPFLEIAKLLTDSYRKFIADHGEGEGKLMYEGMVKNVVGQEGLQTAKALTDHMDLVDKMYEDYQKVQQIETSIHQFQETWTQTWASFKTNLENIGIDIVMQSMEDLTVMLKTIRPYVDSFGEWAKNNQGFVTTIVKGTVAVSGLLIGLGAAKVVLGTIAKLMIGGFSFGAAPIKWAAKLVMSLMDLKIFFSVLRLEGNGFWKSLSQGAQAAWPWFGKLAGWVRTFTPFWLTNAARIAAGWLLAMGPVGWIIAGVTAIITGAVAAWKTNFFGFRDKCQAVWSWIEDYVEYILPGISGKISQFIQDAKQTWEGLKQCIGAKWDAVSQKTQEIMSGIEGIVKAACNTMGIDFDNLAEKAQGALQSLWDAQPGVQAYKAIKKHFNDFDAWRTSQHEGAGFRTLRGDDVRLEVRGQSKPEEQPFRFMGNQPQSAYYVQPLMTRSQTSHYRVERPVSHLVRPVIQLPEKKVDRERKAERPFVAPPTIARQQSDFRQVNNFTVKSNGEAAEIAKRVVPKKYTSEDNNPRNLTPVMV